jgi:hypothetical protein
VIVEAFIKMAGKPWRRSWRPDKADTPAEAACGLESVSFPSELAAAAELLVAATNLHHTSPLKLVPKMVTSVARSPRDKDGSILRTCSSL